MVSGKMKIWSQIMWVANLYSWPPWHMTSFCFLKELVFSACDFWYVSINQSFESCWDIRSVSFSSSGLMHKKPTHIFILLPCIHQLKDPFLRETFLDSFLHLFSYPPVPLLWVLAMMAIKQLVVNSSHC